MAIFGIVLLGFLSLFTSGILYEFSAGRKSDKIFDAQAAMDTAISGTATAAVSNFSFSIPDGKYLYVNGEWFSVALSTSDGKTVFTKAFLPVKNSIITSGLLVTLTFDSSGGSPVPSVLAAAGTPVALPPNPTRTGYSFAGWEPDCPAYMPDDALTLMAQWTAATVTVTFDKNHSNATTPVPLSITATYDQPYGSLASVSRPGKTFLGWYTAKNGGTEVTSSTLVTNLSDHTLYAHWG